jgi:hypothetical protein
MIILQLIMVGPTFRSHFLKVKSAVFKKIYFRQTYFYDKNILKSYKELTKVTFLTL